MLASCVSGFARILAHLSCIIYEGQPTQGIYAPRYTLRLGRDAAPSNPEKPKAGKAVKRVTLIRNTAGIALVCPEERDIIRSKARPYGQATRMRMSMTFAGFALARAYGERQRRNDG